MTALASQSLFRRRVDDLPYRLSSMDPEDEPVGASERPTGGGDNSPILSRTPLRKREPPAETGNFKLEGREHASHLQPGPGEESNDQICICTPAPKIPRPRNAFILYRQHHQQQVTQENPRLSNPEISKIIGQKWKDEKAEIKDDWKRLAEEEKQRHQLQYPDYRYQPRRGARAQATRTGSILADDQERCKKCNGRLIATPRTPSGTYETPALSEAGSEPRSHPGIDKMEIGLQRRSSLDVHQLRPTKPPSRAPYQESADLGSPESKRQRVNRAGEYQPLKLPSIQSATFEDRPLSDHWRTRSDETPRVVRRAFGDAPTLPDLRNLPRSDMPPPPPPLPPPPARSAGPNLEHRSNLSGPVQLPPLQTALSASSSRSSLGEMVSVSSGPPGSGSAFSAAPRGQGVSNLEVQIMSMSFKRKLGVLARIAKPIPIPPRDAPFPTRRGAFVAVEGPDQNLLHEVGDIVEHGLRAGDRTDVRLFSVDERFGPRSWRNFPPSRSMEPRASPDEEYFPSRYFGVILEWQEKSKEIVEFVTQRPLPPIASSQQPPGTTSPRRTPVALVKDGFSLTTVDHFGCSTPIDDGYPPVDHWQWMASLWRGTACPDLVVYVKPSSNDEIRKAGSVEFVRQTGIMVVRAQWGKGLDEAAERRIIFEVSEWLRGELFLERDMSLWRQEGL